MAPNVKDLLFSMKKKNIHVKDLHGTVANHNFLPSKQKLELNSSKNRLLLSRSGGLIEFKNGDFTGYSRAIQGLQLDFSPSWG